MNGNRSGFTIIEILVAILIFGILMVVLSSTLSGSLKLNQESQQELGTTSSVQNLTEQIRRAWTVQTNYDAACVDGLTLPDGYTAKFINLSSRAEAITQANAVADPSSSAPVNDIKKSACATAAPNATLTGGAVPTMRRIVVQTGTLSGTDQVVGARDVKLELDVLRPQ
ncbi:prepilin-type N-terminal cleavage/methylation domain-containing protein [Deinococcus cavernae]|uniref:Prepilin-type N-terminal cleavage/methylation domain-containing protein n=1 Tax=Deinococcus cavernae TaxID=2320857 RepID=A0A418V9S4_9DEIO|nr:prepilin-type N-terminal cleavage/methylation domain-containing protein [Deinococcus cavernae]RJF72802.1 prepilin-type N-terminal cleavage/methylation domain-containing protein [Deinococcus cavernae]